MVSEPTKQAQGVRVKGGLVRRIAVTMDEDLFFAVKELAIKESTSISAKIVRLVRAQIGK